MSEFSVGSAPGHPGAGPHWESARKTGAGRACNFRSRVWFTLGEGILNEIYFPAPDDPCTKDAGFIVTDGAALFSEERRDTLSEVRWAAPGGPAFYVVNTHRGGLYRIRKEIVADPDRDVVLQRTRFEALKGSSADYRLYLLLAPHLGDEGIHNTASVGSYKGRPMLFAESREAALAVACSTGWKECSAGYVGVSDGWQDLSRHKELQWHYHEAKDGNVALTGEIQLLTSESFTLVIGFGRNREEAAFQVCTSLREDFDQLWKRYLDEWEGWQAPLLRLDEDMPALIVPQSTAVLRTHESVEQKGAHVASLSVPWGEVQTQEHAAGYHGVWARDCAQSALGLLAVGAKADVLRTLDYLALVQESDGHWPQLMGTDGRELWSGIQIDSIAAPILLYEIASQEGLYPDTPSRTRQIPMVMKAAAYICRNGPITPQDRWERNGGFSAYTLAMATAGLVIAAGAAREIGENDFARYLEENADAWNAQIENWTYCEGSALAVSLGLPGTHCRIVPADDLGRPHFKGQVSLGNSMIKKKAGADEMVSPDVWALVRLGLRAASDERICATTRAIDAMVKTDTPRGPVWHRYNNDGYGEKPDGAPFCREGVGRAWPLLIGERAHYELARGNRDEARRLIEALENFSNEVGLLPEQVWDTHDLPERQLHLGHATGSARPLAWAHAEYLQLLRSIRDKHIFGCPNIVAQRYAERQTPARHTLWRPQLQTAHLIKGTMLRIEMPASFRVHWKSEAGRGEAESCASPVGLHFADLPTHEITSGSIAFSFTPRDQRSATSGYEMMVR